MNELLLPPHSTDIDEEFRRVTLSLQTVFSPQQQHQQSQQGLPNHLHHAWWTQRQLADRYLTSFQSTTLSWMICDRLLQQGIDVPNGNNHNNNDLSNDPIIEQRRFFAAQTLHKKCRTNIEELPPDSLPMLRNSLLQHLQRYITNNHHPSSDTALIIRLSMCISALAVQMEWITIVTDLLQHNNNNNDNNYVQDDGTSTSTTITTTTTTPVRYRMAMSILRTLPEECASDRLLLIDDRSRFKMRDHLVSSATIMFSFLQQSLEQSGQVVSVLKTLYIWIRYVPIRPDTLVSSPLLPWTVQAMTQPDYLEAAADVLVEVLRMYPSHHDGNETLVRSLIPSLSQLPLDAALLSENEDVMRAYSRVVTEMGESYMSLVLLSHQRPPQPLQTNEALQLVEAVLKCSRIPDPDIAGITLHFWYQFVSRMEELQPYEWRQTVVDTYTPILLQLIQACCVSLMKYPDDYDEMADDIVADLQRHRQYVEETIEDCCRLMGQQGPVRLINTILHEEVQKIIAGRSESEWHGLESCLACLAAMHRFIPRDEEDVLPYCFQLIPQLPPLIRPLRSTACVIIGRYAPWLSMHPEYMPPLLPYLIQSLSDPETSSAAAMAIKDLCGRSNAHFPLGEPVLQLYEEIAASSKLNLNDEIHILEGACTAISRTIQDTHDDGRQCLLRLAVPIGNRFTLIVTDQNTTSKRIIAEIERLTTIVRYLTVPYLPPNTHPVIELFQSLWTLLDASVNRFPTDYNLCESVCRLHKHTIRTLGANAYAPMVGSLMDQLIVSFKKTHQSSFLYAASICITEYGRDKQYSEKLFHTVASLAATVFSFNQNLEDLTSHPDVAEEFFFLLGRMISYCPDPIVHSNLLEAVTQCAVVGMQIDHHGANKGTLNFLDSTISYGLELQKQNNTESLGVLERAVAKEGHIMVSNLAKAMIGELPLYSNQIDDILWKLSLLFPSLLKQWLSDAFTTITSAPDRAKIELISALDAGLGREEFSIVVNAFESACDRRKRFR